jgi:hypothetical protein|tara:strand:- start:351 stop:548 length:198 start_codon:yes stop_codon:yes gene_type:complete
MDTYVLWWNSSPRKYIFGVNKLRECAERYEFSAEDVLRFGSIEFDDDDGFGVYGGCYKEEERDED